MSHLRRLLVSLPLLVPLGFTRPLCAQMTATADGEPVTTIHGFTDLTYLTGGRNTGRTSAFGVGQYDLYITSRVTDRLLFVGETVFEFDDATSEFGVDVERVIARYALNEHLSLSVGKVHTPLGYWNNAYHHGTVMQPTISRPELVQFEDDGGPLPIHTTGALFSGRDLGPAHLGFDAMLGNGLGNRPTSDDRNPARAVTLAVHSQVTTNLRVGLSGYQDQVATGTPTLRGDTLLSALTQTIAGAFAAYFTERAEAIVEGHQIANRSGGRTTTSRAWFAYAGLRFHNKLVPYLLHESTRLDDGDPYFVAEQSRRATVGVRWEESASAVYKLELRDTERRDLPRASEAALQLALAF